VPETNDYIKRKLQRDRWNRKRKLLPNLKLKYPSDDELRYIAELARVDGQSIRSIILDAHLYHAQFRTLSIPRVRGALKSVVNQANRLRKILGQLDVGRGSRGSENYAGYLIEGELSVLKQIDSEKMILMPAYIDLLDALSSAAQRAEQKLMHLPKGASGNPAFDFFIQNLLAAAWMRGGSWTNYRSRDGTWKGTLPEALKILQKYLPQRGFFPPGELGRSVEHIRKKLKDHMQRAREKEC
jgi:hypothetical protein